MVYNTQLIILYKALVDIHTRIPQRVGIIIDSNVHFTDFVSAFMVRQVVEHGQCIREKSIVQTAVFIVQPFNCKISFVCIRSIPSAKTPVELYNIRAIGNTISYAEQFCK